MRDIIVSDEMIQASVTRAGSPYSPCIDPTSDQNFTRDVYEELHSTVQYSELASTHVVTISYLIFL